MKYATILLAFLSISVHAQKSNFKINTKIDDFTGDTSIVSTPFSMGWGSSAQLSFLLYSSEGTTYLIAQLSTDELTIIPENGKMLMKLDDGTMITVTALERAISDIVSLGNYKTTAVYQIRDDDLLILTKVPVSKIRVETSDNYHDLPPLGKKYPLDAMANFSKYYNEVID